MKCRLCQEKFTPKQKKPTPDFENHIHALVHIVGNSIFEGVCDDKKCQDYANYEAQEFDRMRKEW
jgi:hypothetical protein